MQLFANRAKKTTYRDHGQENIARSNSLIRRGVRIDLVVDNRCGENHSAAQITDNCDMIGLD